MVWRLQPARAEGLGAALRGASATRYLLGMALTAVVPATLLPARVAMAAVLTAVAATAGMASLARRQVGGFTGDILGAAEQVTECAVLSCLAALLTR
jgi:adenosylcobinamide-GDP ribazoletransferase